MKRLIQAASAAMIALLLAVPTALGAADSTPRGDSYYPIFCTTAEGVTYLAKRVDVNAIQLEKDPGGKDTATEHFNANNPYGEHCVDGDLVPAP